MPCQGRTQQSRQQVQDLQRQGQIQRQGMWENALGQGCQLAPLQRLIFSLRAKKMYHHKMLEKRLDYCPYSVAQSFLSGLAAELLGIWKRDGGMLGDEMVEMIAVFGIDTVLIE